MILNLLKLIFIYFIYRFIKTLIKGYVKNKLKQAAENMQDQMRGGFEYHQRNSTSSDQQNYNSRGNVSSQGAPKTFEAEYKVIKD